MADAFTNTTFKAEDLEIRSKGDGRTLVGIAVPFDTEASLGREREVFRRGAFAKTVSEGNPSKVKLFGMHDDKRTLPIGAATRLEETSAGLLAEFKVARTQAGDEALSLVQDGVLDSFSVGFVPIRSTRSSDGVIERREVKLIETSLVAYPAYETAKVLAIRSQEPDADAPMSLAQARLIATQLRQSAPDISFTR